MRVNNILFELLIVKVFCSFGSLKHFPTKIMFTENIVSIYANKNTNIRYVSKFFSKFEISRRTEVTDNSKKAVKSVHAISNTL